MTKSITVLQSCTGMNNACMSHYRSNNTSLLYTTSNFSLKEMNLKCFGGHLSLLSSRKGLLNGATIKSYELKLLGPAEPATIASALLALGKFVVCSNGSLPSPPSSNPFGWVVGILLSIALPFFRFKWGSLLQLKNKVEDVIETVEDVVDGVEKVAETIDEVTENIANALPESQLKNALKTIENFSEDTARAAHAAGDFIDQMQGEDVELVEEVVDLPKEQLNVLSEKTAKVAHAAEDLKDKVKEVEVKVEEIPVKSLVETVKEEVNKSTLVDVLDITNNSKK